MKDERAALERIINEELGSMWQDDVFGVSQTVYGKPAAKSNDIPTGVWDKIRDMGGITPTTASQYSNSEGAWGSRLFARKPELESPALQKQRDTAFSDLLSIGYSPQQIEEMAQQYQGEQAVDSVEKMSPFIREGAATVGSLAGTALGAPVRGAMIGGGVGEKILQLMQEKVGSEYAPKSSGEAARRQLANMAVEGGTEHVGNVIGRVINPIGTFTTPGAREASEALESAGRRMPVDKLSPGAQKYLGKYGSGLTPAQMTEHRFMDTIESISEHAVGGNVLYQKKDIIQPRALQQLTRDIVDGISTGGGRLTPSQAGAALLESLTQKEAAFDAAAKGLYTSFYDDLANLGLADVPLVDMAPIKALADSRLGKGKSMARSQMGVDLLENITEQPDRLTFWEAVQRRTEIRKRAESMGMTKDVAEKVAMDLYDAMNDAFDDVASKLPKDMVPRWKAINKWYATNKQPFYKQVVLKLQKDLPENPEKYTSMFSKNAVEQIKAVKKLVSQEAFDKAKVAWLDEMITSSSNADGVLLGKTFAKKLNTMGDDVLIETFGFDHAQDLRKLASAAMLSQKPTGGGGSLLGPLMQAGEAVQAGSSIATGQGVRGSTAAIVLSPLMVGKILANPTVTKFLTRASTLQPGSKAAIAASIRFARVTAAMKNYEDKQAAEIKRRKQKQAASKNYQENVSYGKYGGRGL